MVEFRRSPKPRSFGRDVRGATAVEFTLLAVPLFATIFAVAETGLDLFCQSSLEAAIRQAARQIQIGKVQQGNFTSNDFKTMVCGYLPSVLSCSNVVFSVQTVSTSFYDLTSSYRGSNGITQYNIKQPSLNQAGNTFCPGASNAYVVAQFLYAVPAITGVWLTSSVTFNGKTVRVVGATEVFRNESFTASNTGAGC